MTWPAPQGLPLKGLPIEPHCLVICVDTNGVRSDVGSLARCRRDHFAYFCPRLGQTRPDAHTYFMNFFAQLTIFIFQLGSTASLLYGVFRIKYAKPTTCGWSRRPRGEEPGGIFAEHTTQCRKEEACSWIRFSTRVVRRSLKRSISYTQATQWLQRNKSRVANLFKFCFKHTNLLPIRLPFSATTLEGAGHKFPCFNLLCSACFIRNIFIIFYFFDFCCKFCKHLVRHIDSGENVTENCSHDSNILCTKVFPA